MKPKLEGRELLRDMGKVTGVSILVLLACGMVLFLTLESISPPGRRTPIVPKFSFDNVGPCLGNGQNLVERFEVGDEQYICADMETNEPNVYLELHIFTNENKNQVYIDGGTFTSGAISFIIYPPLPPGKYWAYISWSRPALVDFNFEVAENAE